MDALGFVSDVGVSDLVPEVAQGKLRPAGEAGRGG
jgi:hypothetical protein